MSKGPFGKRIHSCNVTPITYEIQRTNSEAILIGKLRLCPGLSITLQRQSTGLLEEALANFDEAIAKTLHLYSGITCLQFETGRPRYFTIQATKTGFVSYYGTFSDELEFRSYLKMEECGYSPEASY